MFENPCFFTANWYLPIANQRFTSLIYIMVSSKVTPLLNQLGVMLLWHQEELLELVQMPAQLQLKVSLINLPSI